MMRCPPVCGRNKKVEKKEMREKAVSHAPREWEEVKAVNWVADEKKDWGREEKMEIDHRKIKGIVPEKFHQ